MSRNIRRTTARAVTAVVTTATLCVAGWAGLLPASAADETPPTVTIDQGASQADPTFNSSITFDVVFSEPVIGFSDSDVNLSGSAGATTAVVTDVGFMNDKYTVTVSGMTTSGTVIASIAAGAAEDVAGNTSDASTSTDNTVTFTFVEGLNDDAYSAESNQALVIDAPGVLLNDQYAVTPPLDLTVVDEAEHGDVQLLDDGGVGYVPDEDFVGIDTFTYTMAGLASGARQVATVTITVSPDGTIVRDDEYTTTAGHSLDVPAPGPLGNDIFPFLQVWHLETCEQPDNATVTCDDDGHLTVKPDDGFTGFLVFDYEVAEVDLLGRVAVAALAPSPTVGTITVHVEADDPGESGDPDESDTEPDAALPDTGSGARWWTAPWGLALLLSGAVVLAASRRPSTASHRSKDDVTRM